MSRADHWALAVAYFAASQTTAITGYPRPIQYGLTVATALLAGRQLGWALLRRRR